MSDGKTPKPPVTGPQKCVVFFSGGLASWAVGKLAVEKYGSENTTLLFTDTLCEDADLYRFLHDGAKNIGAELVILREGRTIWEVFRDVKILGNSRIDPCSRVLKREPAERWLKANCDPQNTSLVFGIDWTESHRYERKDVDAKTGAKVMRGVKPRYTRLGWPHIEAVCTLAPFLGKSGMTEMARDAGVRPSRAYAQGFPHDNCGGGCVKAGKAAFEHLLRTRPEVYAMWEREEDAFNDSRPDKKRKTILRDEFTDKPTEQVSLKELRKRIQSSAQLSMFDDWGGCGCFIEAEDFEDAETD